MKKLLLILMLFVSLFVNAQVKGVIGEHWVGTWATAQQPVVKAYMPYNNNMSNRSVRQIVKVSIGGKLIRLQISNELSNEPLVIRSVYIAHAKDSSAVDAKTAKYLKFGNKYNITIPAGKTKFSDALVYDLKPLERLAITINYTSAPANPTVHMGSRTTSYIMRGVTNANSNFSMHSVKIIGLILQQ